MWAQGYCTSFVICLQPATHKMDQYVINIPNEKATSYKLVSFIIAVINLAAFVFYLTKGGSVYYSLVGAIIAAFCVLYLLTLRTWKWPQGLNAEAGFVALAILWGLTGNYFPGFLMIVFSALGFYTNRNAAIRFTQQGIYYPSMPVKLFTWDMVDFAMIKDGILTIELKDNRIFQFTLGREEMLRVDENAFNIFCKQASEA